MTEVKTCKANYPIDLHCHTTRSDGADTPEELIERAAGLNMKIVAITDHDRRPPEKAGGLPIAEFAERCGINVLPGIEISCETLVEDCHIVCFGCDWENHWFEELEESVVQSKTDSYQELVRRLQGAGYEITWEQVLENGGSPVPERFVQKKMLFELLARKGYFPTWSEAKLMMKRTPEFQINRTKPDPGEVIAAIHRCGGIAILAHPYLIREPVAGKGGKQSRDAYIRGLFDRGLDGIEARYTYEKTSYDGTLSGEEVANQVRSRYGGIARVISGGSDYHADQKKNAAVVRNLGECGLTVKEFMDNAVLRSLVPDLERFIEEG